jgi:hypothetical protein
MYYRRNCVSSWSLTRIINTELINVRNALCCESDKWLGMLKVIVTTTEEALFEKVKGCRWLSNSPLCRGSQSFIAVLKGH